MIVLFFSVKTVFSDTLLIDNTDTYTSNNLYTKSDAQSGFFNNERYHGSVVIDNATPLENNDIPVFTDVWKYLIGEN